MSPRPITIVGGGLAGLSLGLFLRRAGVPVVILEAGNYPRHRVCGEFLSGRGQAILDELGLRPACDASGAREAITACFADHRTLGPVRRLPQPALCLSRYALDALMASAFLQLGGNLETGQRIPIPGPRPGWVRATGRRPAPPGGRWRWFGVKAHALGVATEADLEMHFSAGSYVGLCRLDADRVNVCGLFRRRGATETPRVTSPEDWLRGDPGSLRRHRLGSCPFDPDSVCAVGALNLRMPGPATPGEVSLGDALAVIPPLTGNGMSLALESARLAAKPLTQYTRGTLEWPEACAIIARLQRRQFGSRLRTAWMLQHLLGWPVVPGVLRTLLHHSDRAWRHLFAATRSGTG